MIIVLFKDSKYADLPLWSCSMADNEFNRSFLLPIVSDLLPIGPQAFSVTS